MLALLYFLATILGSPGADAPAGHFSPMGPAREWRVPPFTGAGKESKWHALPSAKAGGATIDPSLTEEAVTDTRIEAIVPDRMIAGGGSMYFVVLELSQGLPTDADTGSACVLLEDGRALGPARATVEQIQSSGRGAYSHVRFATLAFSSSDNTSPITNGRTYSLDCTRRIVVSRSRVVAAAPSVSFEIASLAGTVWNRRTTIRNLDPVDAVRTRIRARGMPDLSSTEGILASILAPGMTPESKAIAIWQLLTNMGYNWHPAQADAEVHDPVKFLNVYGYGYCDDFAESFAALTGAAGIPSRIHYLGGHIVAESFYDGQWHMFDPDFGLYFRGADGHVLSVEELASDPTPLPSFLVDIYTSTADNTVGTPSGSTLHRMEPVLKPGDELVFDSGPASIVRNVYLTDKPNPPLAGTGTLTRTLAFPGSPGEVVVPFEWPYVLVGGRFTGDGEVAISANGVDWTTTRDFESWFAGRSEASYGFHVRVRNPGASGVLSVAFQFAPLSLPAVQPGVTTFDLDIVPVSGSLGPDWRGVEVVQEWEDRTAPGTYAIATGVTPAAGGIARCSPDPVAAGGTVSCTATPHPGYAFTGWSGDCVGATCTLANVNAVKSVAAAFNWVGYTVATSASPLNGGVVACTPNPVDQGGTSTCSATANAGHTFTGWTGDCSGNTCTLANVTGPRSVVAQFNVNTYAIAAIASPVSGGTASCLPNPVAHGGTATCTASASVGYVFAGWNGDCTGLECTLSGVTSPRSVTARFVVATHAITVGVDPAAGGTARCVPNLVLHGGTAICTASVSAGYVFAGWSGDCTGPSCTLTNVTAVRSVTARFDLDGIAITTRANPPPGGSASCTPNPAPPGTWVTCKATPSAGFAFMGWSDETCGGTGPCMFIATQTVIVTANFATPSNATPRLANISTRMQVLPGNGALIGGFVIGGTENKTVVIRARGPSLGAAGVPNVLANPVLQLFSAQTQIAYNNDWPRALNAATIRASGLAPQYPEEAAIHTVLAPGAYTAIMTAGSFGRGIGIIEIFEVDRPESPLVNISSRGPIQTGDDIMIGGFIIQGNSPQTVIIRARGPSLESFGVTGALADPVLDLYSGSTRIATNDNWNTASNAFAIQASGFAPADARESAILITLDPGAYTAIVRGASGSTGVGIVEVFAQ